MQTVNILGTEYEIIFSTADEYEELKDIDGFTDTSSHTIIIDDMSSVAGQVGMKKNMENYKENVIRHELIHAFLFESGLDTCSKQSEAWASNEEMVDWFAIQSPKIFKVFSELGIIEHENINPFSSLVNALKTLAKAKTVSEVVNDTNNGTDQG